MQRKRQNIKFYSNKINLNVHFFTNKHTIRYWYKTNWNPHLLQNNFINPRLVCTFHWGIKLITLLIKNIFDFDPLFLYILLRLKIYINKFNESLLIL